MSLPKIVSRDEWVAARTALLAKENKTDENHAKLAAW